MDLFGPRNSSGSCLNYLIHESWFLLDEIWISYCSCRKGDHLLTKCHRMSHIAWTAISQIQSPMSDQMNCSRHAPSRPAATMQQTCKTEAFALEFGNQDLRCLAMWLKFSWRVCTRICSSQDTSISKPGFDTVNSKTIHFLGHFNSFKIHSSTLWRW